jgi:rhamnogalacturonyl hydrolase YesR
MRFNPIVALTTLLFTIITLNTHAQNNDYETLHLTVQPEQVGKRIVQNIVERRFGWRYQKVCSYYGALIFADATANKNISEQIKKGYTPFYTGKRKYRSEHVDFNVFGIWPFELYRQFEDSQYLEQAKKLADAEWENPRQDGLTNLTRFWIDDMYMVGSLQVQAYKSLKDEKYLDRAALQLIAYVDSLQKPNGLFFHREDAPFYWGRGNGWAATAMTELFLVLPKEHEHYNELLTDYQRMMAALKTNQGSNGMWHQLLDNPDSFAEPSCTGMFLYAIASGVHLGILSKEEYLPVIEKAWNELATNFVNKKGEVVDVCMWTNAKSRENYYLRRPKVTGDYHGQAAVLWAATAIIKLQQSN